MVIYGVAPNKRRQILFPCWDTLMTPWKQDGICGILAAILGLATRGGRSDEIKS